MLLSFHRSHRKPADDVALEEKYNPKDWNEGDHPYDRRFSPLDPL